VGAIIRWPEGVETGIIAAMNLRLMPVPATPRGRCNGGAVGGIALHASRFPGPNPLAP
jgi:hypothetical protein